MHSDLANSFAPAAGTLKAEPV